MPISLETLQFLAENRIQNSKSWFHEHKAQYQALVLEPMVELVQGLAPAVLEIDPMLVTEPRVCRTISRIYRDTRFTRDKSIYREVMWCAFVRDKKAYPDWPGLVVEFSPDGFRYGCGYYCAPPALIETVRGLILAGDPDFLKARDFVEGQTLYRLEGERYRRNRYPDQPEGLRSWLDRKNLLLIHNSQDFDLLFSEGFAQVVGRDLLTLKPFYDFITKAQLLTGRRGEEEMGR